MFLPNSAIFLKYSSNLCKLYLIFRVLKMLIFDSFCQCFCCFCGEEIFLRLLFCYSASTVVLFPQGMCSKTLSGSLKPQVVLNPIAISRNTSAHAFHPQIYIFSILTKYLPCTKGHYFCHLRCDSKTSTNLFFVLHNFTDRFLLQILATSTYTFFLSFLNQELSPFHSKEVLYGFSLAYANC